MQLPPMFENVNVRIGKGRYAVQLELPEGSTLTPYETERLLALSTWDADPNKEVDNYEGGRAVILRRESPINKNGVNLGGLQVSGIGYKQLNLKGDIGFYADLPFQPPNSDNFLDHVTGTKMSTSYARGNKIETKRPAYRALGTYVHSELREKLKNTMDVSALPLTKLVVPHVEAYGRYLDPGMQNEEGPFGFCVFPAPDPGIERVMTMASRQVFSHITPVTTVEEFIMMYYFAMTPHICALIAGLRELHDSGFVHLQPHLSNAYTVNKMPYLVDWGTSQRLGADREENVLNRTLDIKTPADSYEKVFVSLVSKSGVPAEFTDLMSAQVKALVMEVYSGSDEEIDIVKIAHRAHATIGEKAGDIGIMAQWMKDMGIEGFPEYWKRRKAGGRSAAGKNYPVDDLVARIAESSASPKTSRKDKTGRNDPCPCGSGVKFKKCCSH